MTIDVHGFRKVLETQDPTIEVSQEFIHIMLNEIELARNLLKAIHKMEVETGGMARRRGGRLEWDRFNVALKEYDNLLGYVAGPFHF